MSTSTGNGEAAASKSVPLPAKSPIPIPERLLFHERLHKQSKCDLETPASIIANVNIKQLLTPAAFDSLPTHYQNELIRLLPETDKIRVDDDSHAMSVNSLSNEFFAKSCVEYRDRLRNGEFTSVASAKVDEEPVVWECNELVLRGHSPKPDIPKAGEAFICTSKNPPNLRKQLVAKAARNGDSAKTIKPASAASKLKKASTLEKLKRANSLIGKTSVKPVKVETVQPPKVTATQSTTLTQKPRIVAHSNLPCKEPLSVQTQVAGVKRPLPANDVRLPARSPNKVVITQFKKVTENNIAGDRVTKVVPIVVRNPHGQVVTTLANCNPLLSQMIKNPVKSSQTTTTPPIIKVERKPQSLLPTILKRNNQVIVTLRNNPNIVSNRNGVNKVVADVISKTQPKPTTNGATQPQPIIVTVNGGNGSVTDKLISTAVNMQRTTKDISDQSKAADVKPTLDLERSYEICKKVLGNAGAAATIVMVGPDGKKTTIQSKPVRNRNVVSATGSSQGIANSSDIPVYRSKHRGKSSLTMSGHLFLALKQDEDDGYSVKAYKRKSAYKQRQKKKLAKGSSKKTVSATSVPSSTSQSNDSSLTTVDSNSVTMVTGTLHSTVPITSIKEEITNNNMKLPSSVGGGSGGYDSLLDSCMCSKRALIICRKCGAFSHAECMDKEECLSCLEKEN